MQVSNIGARKTSHEHEPSSPKHRTLTLRHGHLWRYRRPHQAQAYPRALQLARTTASSPNNLPSLASHRNDLTTETFRNSLSEEIPKYAPAQIDLKIWEWFKERIYYVKGDFQRS